MVESGKEQRLRLALERALPSLAESPGEDTVRRRLRERIRRDLLPRLSGDHATLLLGIAGPNNVGKSTLFNAFLGRHLSPARAEGGLTKQCLAAAHPSLWDGPMRELIGRRYDVVRVERAEDAPVTEPGPPGRLYLLLDAQCTPGVLVMDTPDFDSIYTGNRAAAEALLVTVDILVFVVSRQTYQNAALVQFLKDAVGQGRPYVLIYNEAPRREIAEEHLVKLVSDVAMSPRAQYFALHQPLVEKGQSFLETHPLKDAPPLMEMLRDERRRSALKTDALRSSLQDAVEEMATVERELRSQSAEPDRLRRRIRHELLVAGERAARRAVPADTLIIAFQDELDARSTFNRVVRRQVRKLASVLTFVGRKVRASFVGDEPASKRRKELADAALRDGLRQTVEALSHEVAVWRDDAQTRELLENALGPVTLDRLQRTLDFPELSHPDDEAELYRFCRELVAKELTGSGREQLLQAVTTLVYSVPVGAAGVLTWATGGVGHDAVVWVTAAVSTPVLEKLVDLLGHGIREDVTRKWAEAHGATLARGLERELFRPLLERLDSVVEQALKDAGNLEVQRADLRRTLAEGGRE
jgi:hypothetical protein